MRIIGLLCEIGLVLIRWPFGNVLRLTCYHKQELVALDKLVTKIKLRVRNRCSEYFGTATGVTSPVIVRGASDDAS